MIEKKLNKQHLIENLELPDHLGLRLATSGDKPDLIAWFCAARPQLASLPLAPAQLQLLLMQQYQLQQQGYAHQYPHALLCIIEAESRAVGHIMLASLDDSLRIVDWGLAVDWRGRGIGSAIIFSLQAHALSEQKKLSLSVDSDNYRAQQLYQRLGFVLVNHTATHQQLLWFPGQP